MKRCTSKFDSEGKNRNSEMEYKTLKIEKKGILMAKIDKKLDSKLNKLSLKGE